MAALVRWDPVREMLALQRAMDRLFEEAFGPVVERRLLAEPRTLAPAVDMYETDDEVVVKATLPGIKPEELEITVTGNVLTLKGEVKEEEKVEKANYICQERRFGMFRRDLTLPVDVDVDKAKAEFENGVLTLTLPKVEEVKPKRLEIKTSR